MTLFKHEQFKHDPDCPETWPERTDEILGSEIMYALHPCPLLQGIGRPAQQRGHQIASQLAGPHVPVPGTTAGLPMALPPWGDGHRTPQSCHALWTHSWLNGHSRDGFHLPKEATRKPVSTLCLTRSGSIISSVSLHPEKLHHSCYKCPQSWPLRIADIAEVD